MDALAIGRRSEAAITALDFAVATAARDYSLFKEQTNNSQNQGYE
jgi:hypothetical protein